MVQEIYNILIHLKNFLKPAALAAIIFSSLLPFILVKHFSKKPANPSTALLNFPLPSSNPDGFISPDSYELSLTQHLLKSITTPEPSSPIFHSSTQDLASLRLNGNSLMDLKSSEHKSKRPTPLVSQTSKQPNAFKDKPKSVNENWRIIKTQEKDSLAKIFKRIGLNNALLNRLTKEVPQIKTLSLKPNQEIKFLLKNNGLEKICLPLTPIQSLIIHRENQVYKSKVHFRKTNTQKQFLTATVQGSLYLTAKKNNIPITLIQQMTQLFSSELNFKKDVKSGDQFTLIYQAIYLDNKYISTGDILAATYKNKTKTFQAFRYTNRAGHTEYYNVKGNSLKKAFDRYPLQFTHISSTFSFNRYHPILRYKKPHRGIDLAAPMGTPIRATGDGYIASIGRQRGYGNTIKIKHSGAYSTIYGHLLRFQKGISKGNFVKRGQVIGYVGQSGLATGPHCHYEFRVNNEPKNPTTINLPQGHPIPAKETAIFKDVINVMLAELQSFEKPIIASR